MSGRVPVLAVENVSVVYDRHPEVDRVSLTIDRPGITALVGPSGCGKTSLLRAVAGFERPTTGRVSIAGVDVAGERCWVPPEQRRVGMVFQQGALFPHLTVWRNVSYGLRGVADAEERTRRALDRVGLADLAYRYPDQLSGGQQQLVALARALAPAPALVLLDEPFASLDAALRTRLREEVRAVLHGAQATAILVTHDQEEALSVGDRIAVMRGGRILQEGTPRSVYRSPACAEVAEFIGGGQLLSCRTRDGRLHCGVGELTTDAPEGDGRLLVRPEDLQVVNGTPGGYEGVIIRRAFYGHDQLHEVRLDSGTVVQVRMLGIDGQGPGDRVRLQLRSGTYRLFPIGGPPALARS